MNKKIIFSLMLLLALSSLILAACGGGTPEENEDPISQEEQINMIYTQAAETLQAEIALTEAAKPQPTSTPLSSPTPVFIATNTPVGLAETPTPFPTLPVLPSPTAVPTQAAVISGRPALRAELMHENPTDGQVFEPGEEFVKYWFFANSGERTWTDQFGLVYVGGDLNMADVGSFNLMDVSLNMTEAGIPNGSKLELAVSMKAPDSPGRYRSIWMLRDDSGQTFGVGALGDEIFWVEIIVRD